MYLLPVLWLLPQVLSAILAPAPPKTPAPTTIIDYLSGDVQYTYFLRHLQKLGLVPVINNMTNVTVFAPVNSAFVDSDLAVNDTAETALRYFSNQRFRVSYLGGNTTILDSLHVVKSGHANKTFPLKISSDGKTYKLNDFAEIVDYDGYAKHQYSFVQTIDRLLPSSFSLCDLLMDTSPESSVINGHPITLAKMMFQSLFYPTKKPVAGMPQSCEQLLANVSTVLLPSDRALESSLSPLQIAYYSVLQHAVDTPSLKPHKNAIHEIKRDILQLLQNFLLTDIVGGLNGTQHGKHKSLWRDNKLNITMGPQDTVVVNGQAQSVAGSTSKVLSDGILHLFDVQPEKPTFLQSLNVTPARMYPKKALYAMHYSRFVEEVRFRHMHRSLDASAFNQTIIVDASDRDDVIDDESFFVGIDDYAISDEDISDEEDTILEDHAPEEAYGNDYEDDFASFAFTNRQQMRYKFLSQFVDVPAELSEKNRYYNKLIDTQLCSKKRIGSCFKVKVSGVYKKEGASVSINDVFEVGPPVIADSFNAIYVSQKDFDTPSSFKSVLAQLISDGVTREHLNHITVDRDLCLQTFKYLHTYDLLQLEDNGKGYTVFLPCGSPDWDSNGAKSEREPASWKKMGLILKYLEKHPDKFKHVLRGLFLEGLIYSDFGVNDGADSYEMVSNLNGNSVNISETYQEGDFNHIITVNKTRFSIPLNSDVFFHQGVIHITRRVLLPDDLQITLRDLIDTSQDEYPDNHSFMELLKKFPKLMEVLRLDESSESPYSLLVPSAESLHSYNITASYERLWEFIEVHLIANSEAEKILNCMSYPGYTRNMSRIIESNRASTVFECTHNPSSRKTFLKLREKSNLLSVFANESPHQVKITDHGCCTQGSGNTSCVFVLDKPIDIRWFDPPNTFLHLHIGWISLGLGIVLGVILVGFCGTTFALCLSRSEKKRPLIPVETGFEHDDTSFMRVTSEEDYRPSNFDYGYETDDDMMRNEHEPLLPRKGEKRVRIGYQSTASSKQPMSPAAPRNIQSQGILKNLDRERNLPSVNI